MYETVIKNGTLVLDGEVASAEIAIQNGKIAAIGHDLQAAHTLDAAGKLVIPGGVDIHLHMQMPLPGGIISADTFASGSRAAAAGGTTTMIDFVSTAPGQSMMDALRARRAEADPAVLIDYGLHMTITPWDFEHLDHDLQAAYDAGCTSVKLYMAYGFALDDAQLYRALSACKKVGAMPVIHAENWPIITALIAQNVAAGRTSPHWHPRSRPASLEGEAVGRAIDIAAYVGTPLHIFHVSAEQAIQRIHQARARGLPISGETCPQYLFLTWDVYDKEGINGALPVCAPPIRGKSHQDALWSALAADDLQLITTDHCPFTAADKAAGLDDFSRIPGGVPSVEMRLSAVYSRGVRGGVLSLNRWADLCCTAPARLMGLTQKGSLTVGKDADIVIFDPHKRHTISPATLHEQAGWTPYDGMEITGWPQLVMSRGEVIVKDGVVRGELGRGHFLHRHPSPLK